MEKVCKQCGRVYTLRHPSERYCSTECRRIGYYEVDEQWRATVRTQRQEEAIDGAPASPAVETIHTDTQ